jgi:hypothetical protein
VRSPSKVKLKGSALLSDMLPKISKSSVAGQCLSLLDDEAKATLENKMEVALSKTMHAELKTTCLLEAHGDKASTALRIYATISLTEMVLR